MDTNGCIELRIPVSQFDCAVKCARAITNADSKYRFHSSGTRTLQNLLSIRVEALSVKMSMGIDVHGWG
jgi:hypothetical protein